MAFHPVEVQLTLVPRARFDVINVAEVIREKFGDLFSHYRKTLYCSLHTTAGYLDQTICARLRNNKKHLEPFFHAFQRLFPPDAGYYHDQLQLRTELSEAQRQCEPQNADSHLTFIGAGLKNCVTYINHPGIPVYFIELDGKYQGIQRKRQTTILAYNVEEVALHDRIAIPMSHHSIDSINLKDPNYGFWDQVQTMLDKYEIEKGRLDIALDRKEQHAGLTVNEFENLLIKKDLAEVLQDPLRYVARKGRSFLSEPSLMPGKVKYYATTDLVHILNELMDALQVGRSVIEKILSRVLSVPASRFLGMKRNISLMVSNGQENGKGHLVQGTYQSPILVQWREAPQRTRYLDVTLTRFK
ncbi:MAG: hypothetical protein ONB44_23150 [candidate division KSB1 bacterium]|nr:hypothetical protein [candidate division KSB1 bacterium]MDZ7305038.1 hypothetical protein [candidate division KSB1 bacterium]MDZ7312898.1 hypothetical protein [candidate division KSB1 bacterium]